MGAASVAGPAASRRHELFNTGIRGVTEFGISGILRGKATFYAKNGGLVVDLSVTVFGTT